MPGLTSAGVHDAAGSYAPMLYALAVVAFISGFAAWWTKLVPRNLHHCRPTMSWFQLDPQSIANRTHAANAQVPSPGAFIARGMIGFTAVSLAGFVPWAFFGKWFRAPGHGGEIGMYVACAVVFIVLSGLFLHRLIIGPGSLGRFYQLFTPAFIVYAIAWIIGWMTLRGHPGSVVGLLAGTALMGAILALAFDAQGQMLKVIAGFCTCPSVSSPACRSQSLSSASSR